MARISKTRKPGDAAKKPDGRLVFVCAVLAALTIAVYGRTLGFGLTNYDDDVYILTNGHVSNGLTPAGIVWAFTTFHASNWHPLTWLSLMLDAQFGAPDPRVFHATNVLLHVANTLLLLLALRRMTGALWRPAAVAVLFAVHPLHVESVAWIAERKDVLSTLFWMLTLYAYARYVERPEAGRYFALAAAFAAGLLAKPMLVTLPVVLILIDFWPLGRLAGNPVTVFGSRGRGGLLLEKVPLLALSAASSVITFIAQRQGSALKDLETFPPGARIENAIVSASTYLVKTVWPTGLAVFYPHPKEALPIASVIAAALSLAAITVCAILAARRVPYLTVGWFWYAATLLPVIGLVQVGSQARADRYTYVPLVGIFIAAAWGAAEVSDFFARRSRALVTTVLLLVIAAFSMAAWVQTQYWRSGVDLFARAVAVTKNNAVAENNLGSALFARGAVDQAVAHFEASHRIDPLYADASANLAGALAQTGRYDTAIELCNETLARAPSHASSHSNLGMALLMKGRLADATAHLREALRLRPGYPVTQGGLGLALLLQGDLTGAIENLRSAASLNPGFFDAHLYLGAALVQSRRFEEAEAQLDEALRIRPGDPQASSYLGIARARGTLILPTPGRS